MVEETYEGQGIAEKHVAGAVVRKFIGYILKLGVDIIVCLGYLQRLFINLILLDATSVSTVLYGCGHRPERGAYR